MTKNTRNGRIAFIVPASDYALLLPCLFSENNPDIKVITIVEEQANWRTLLKAKRLKRGVFYAVDEGVLMLFESIFKPWKGAESLMLNRTPPNICRIKHKQFSQAYEKLKNFNPNVIILYGCSIVPLNILEIAKASLNVHPGILPKYRGIGSYTAMMKNQFSEVGYSIHLATKIVDSGQVVFAERIPFEFRYLNIANLYTDVSCRAANKLNYALEAANDSVAPRVEKTGEYHWYYGFLGMMRIYLNYFVRKYIRPD